MCVVCNLNCSLITEDIWWFGNQEISSLTSAMTLTKSFNLIFFVSLSPGFNYYLQADNISSSLNSKFPTFILLCISSFPHSSPTTCHAPYYPIEIQTLPLPRRNPHPSRMAVNTNIARTVESREDGMRWAWGSSGTVSQRDDKSGGNHKMSIKTHGLLKRWGMMNPGGVHTGVHYTILLAFLCVWNSHNNTGKKMRQMLQHGWNLKTLY